MLPVISQTSDVLSGACRHRRFQQTDYKSLGPRRTGFGRRRALMEGFQKAECTLIMCLEEEEEEQQKSSLMREKQARTGAIQ